MTWYKLFFPPSAKEFAPLSETSTTAGAPAAAPKPVQLDPSSSTSRSEASEYLSQDEPQLSARTGVVQLCGVWEKTCYVGTRNSYRQGGGLLVWGGGGAGIMCQGGGSWSTRSWGVRRECTKHNESRIRTGTVLTRLYSPHNNPEVKLLETRNNNR